MYHPLVCTPERIETAGPRHTHSHTPAALAWLQRTSKRSVPRSEAGGGAAIKPKWRKVNYRPLCRSMAPMEFALTRGIKKAIDQRRGAPSSRETRRHRRRIRCVHRRSHNSPPETRRRLSGGEKIKYEKRDSEAAVKPAAAASNCHASSAETPDGRPGAQERALPTRTMSENV